MLRQQYYHDRKIILLVLLLNEDFKTYLVKNKIIKQQNYKRS